MRKIEGRAQLLQVVGSRIAQRHPHEPRRLTGPPARIAQAHRLDVSAASHEVSAIDDHHDTMLPARSDTPISTGVRCLTRAASDRRSRELKNGSGDHGQCS